MAENEAELRSSRMEAEFNKNKLSKIQAERDKIHKRIIKDSEGAFNDALLSNLKALQDLNKRLGGTADKIGSANKNKTISATGAASSGNKDFAKNSSDIIKHAQTQISLLKSIDSSLLKVTSLLKPQFDVFQKNLDALRVKIDDRKPVTVFQTAKDPKKSAFKKALDTIFGVGAPPQEVYVSNWRELREGRARTRRDLMSVVGQMLSGGVIGQLTGLGEHFGRSVRYEQPLHQVRRMFTEVKSGAKAQDVLARETKAAQMTEIEKKFSGAAGTSASVTWSGLFSLFSKQGREEFAKAYGEVFKDSFKAQKALLLADMSTDIMDKYKSKGARFPYRKAGRELHEAAVSRMGTIKFQGMDSIFTEQMDKELKAQINATFIKPMKKTPLGSLVNKGKDLYDGINSDVIKEKVGNLKNKLSGFSFNKEQAIQMAKDLYGSTTGKLKDLTKADKHQIKQIAKAIYTTSYDKVNDAQYNIKEKVKTKLESEKITGIINNVLEKSKGFSDKAKAFINPSIDSATNKFNDVSKNLSNVFSKDKAKVMIKSFITTIKILKTLDKIKENTDKMVELMQNGGFGGNGQQQKGFFGRTYDKFKNRESFKLSGVGGGGLKSIFSGIGTVAALPFMLAKGFLGKIFGNGSFKLSGLGGGGLLKMLSMPFNIFKKGAGAVGSVGGAIGSAITKVVGPDAFRLRKAKGKNKNLQSIKSPWPIEDTVYAIYKLLDKRLPGSSKWGVDKKNLFKEKMGKSISSAGSFLTKTLSSVLSNPAALGAMMAAGSTAAAVSAITGTIFERKNQKEMLSKHTALNSSTLASKYNFKEKYGISAEEFKALNDRRKANGLAPIPSLKAYANIKEQGLDANTVNNVNQAGKNKPLTSVSSIPTQSMTVMPTTAIGIPGMSQGSIVSQNQNIVNGRILSSEDERMQKLMKFMLGEFTNNFVMNLGKVGLSNGSDTNKSISKNGVPSLNVFK